MIKVDFKVKELDDQIDIINSFLSYKNEMSIVVAEHFDLNLDALLDLQGNKKLKVITNAVVSSYNKNIEIMQKNCKKFQQVWYKKQKFINKEMFKIFGKEYNFDSVAYVNLNPIWPRYLKEKAFDVNVNASQDFLLSSCCHEILHFVWFEIWKENFKDYKEEEFEYPNLVWLLSEIAIEPMFKYSRLKELSNTKPAYDCFYTEIIDNKTVAELANEIYLQSKDIKDFQLQLYNFFKDKNISQLIK